MCGCVCFQADLISNPAKTTLHWPPTTIPVFSRLARRESTVSVT